MRYRIALVEYLNTRPFSEGFRITGLEDQHEVHRVTPAQCAEMFEMGKVDISLCPVGALDEMPSHDIVGSYCIGADGVVKTVVLLSKVPIEAIRAVKMDAHSRTSNLLLQILADRWWRKEWTFYTTEEADPESCVMIGDKVFEAKQHFAYQYDLAQAWKQLTGLPMVFAVWIARPDVPRSVMDHIDAAFEAGLAHIREGSDHLAPWQLEYLTENISYPLDPAKLKALSLYAQWSDSLAVNREP